ncbi:MAG: outer membrane beta-barrel protein [Chitinophagaceae bacterium]
MKKTTYLFIASLFLLCSTGLFAQDGGLTLKLNYSLAVPSGSSKDVISNTSYRGFGAELMYHLNNKLALGLETGNQDFYQKYPRQLYKMADGTELSAVIANSIQTVPILLKVQYNLLPGAIIQPYLALGAGGNIITYNQYAGQFSNDGKTKFSFAARPEAGVYVPFRKGSAAGVSLGAGYNYMPFKYNGIDNLNSIAARIGVSFPLGN